MKFEKHKPEKDLRGVDPKPTTRCKGQSSFLQIWLLGELLEDSEQGGKELLRLCSPLTVPTDNFEFNQRPARIQGVSAGLDVSLWKHFAATNN
jgi:hypothetical protein